MMGTLTWITEHRLISGVIAGVIAGLIVAAILALFGIIDDHPTAVAITLPVHGSEVVWSPTGHLVTGTHSGIKNGQQIYVLVHPLPTDLWWVQRVPVTMDGNWETTVYFGEEIVGYGDLYQVCAIITNKTLSVGQKIQLKNFPSYVARDIVRVQRKAEEETVSAPDTPSGPSGGDIGESLTYSTGGASSSEGHSIQYRFDWDDGSYSDWSSSTTAFHSWSSEGTYTVKAQARCTTHTSITSSWSDGKSVIISPVLGWSVSREGNVVEIAYGSGSHFPQFAALHLDNGFFRMNYGPESSWGTSIIVIPSFWEGGTLYQGAPISSTWEIVDSNLVLSIDGTISGLNVNGEIHLSPPTDDSISATVMIDVDGDVELDDRPGEAFKLVTLVSMHISSDQWDAQSAFAGSNSITIPTSSWILDPPVTDRLFGLQGGTSGRKVNAPTIAVSLDRDVAITGWVTPSNDPNDDNVAFWGALETVVPSWQYTVTARP